MRRRHAWLLLSCALAAGACSSQDRTRLAVTVYSDLSVPLEIDTLRIEVQGPTGLKQVEYALAAQLTEGKYTLPVQTILVPQGGKEDAFTVTASGIKDRNAVITRTARLSFISDEARELIIFLNRDCYQRTCDGSDKTCVAGICVSNTVNPKDLPGYTTNVKGTATSTTTKTGDAAWGEANDLDGGSEAGSPPLGDARPPSDTSRDLQRDETGNTADAPELTFDADPNTSGNPSPDAPLAVTDTPPSSTRDTGPILPGPDSATPDSKPGADTTTVTVTDTALAPDAPQLSPDTASALPDTPPVSPDAPVDVPCPPGCTLDAKRCVVGSTGVQICITLSNGCTAWSDEQRCGTHQWCQGDEPTAACECKSTNSAHCPIPGGTTGKFCEGTELLQACTQDTDGCYYVVPSQTCTLAKPCSGVDGSASCSCGATPVPCDTAPKAGTYCNAEKDQVYSCDYVSGCMVATLGDTCPSDKPCYQTEADVAECKCPTVAECDSAEEINHGYCSLNTAIACSPTISGCQQVSKTFCLTNQTCHVSGNTASCPCTDAACTNPSGGTFDVNHQACDTDARVLTCGTVDSCPGITGNTTCANGTVCRASGTTARCLPVFGLYDELPGTGQRYANKLIGYPISVTTAGTLAKVGLIVKSLPATGTPSVKMGVYFGTDQTRVVSLEGILSVGRNELTPSSTVTLTTGTYWVFTLFSMDGVSVAQTLPNVTRRSGDRDYANPLPADMSGTGYESGPPSNYYLIVSP